jgi:hypothetical protein
MTGRRDASPGTAPSRALAVRTHGWTANARVADTNDYAVGVLQ